MKRMNRKGEIMKCRTQIAVLVAVVFVFSMPSAARATIVELPLDCAGEYGSGPSYWSTDFDLGVAFTDISHVYMDWSGEITGGLGEYDFHPGEPFPLDVGIYASLGFNPGLRRVTIWGGKATYPDPELFDCLSEFELSGTSTWSDLLDGQGTTQIYYTEPIIADGWVVQHGFVTLDSATLVVDGTIVPEPATVSLFAFGALALRAVTS